MQWGHCGELARLLAVAAMKVVILAGGKGTRLSEETENKPKPMVEIGGKPILWHIMKHYQRHGFDEFFIALGYKGEVIKKYFLEDSTLSGSVTITSTGEVISHYDGLREPWTVHLMDTGLETMTGGRVKRLQKYLQDSPFMVTYGDGVGTVDLEELLKTHKHQGKMATLTAVRPPARFGGLLFNTNGSVWFTEKSQAEEGWINGGFLVCEPGIFDYLEDDSTSFEAGLLERLAADNQLAAFRHYGFWQCMDTLREKHLLENLWATGDAPWKTWED